MNQIPYKPEALELLQSGAIALAELECNGMAVDVDYMTTTIARIGRRVKRMQDELSKSDVAKVWKKEFGSTTNFGSDDQLATVLFDKMGFVSNKTTAKGKRSTDKEALESIDHPFVEVRTEVEEIKRAGKALEGTLREVVDGRVHGFFNLHIPRTFRSSMDSPNLQNVSVRDPFIGPLVRKAFIASEGRQLVEVDFKGAEVCVGACYHKDENMITYILDKSKDMHRDCAMQIFKLPKEEVTKEIRHRAKNQFVFAEFYGSWYFQCAPKLWKDVGKLFTKSGMSLKDHLAGNGIKELGSTNFKERPTKGTFIHHLGEIEKDLWGNRFRGYDKWRKDFFNEYQKRTYFETLTGFICQGLMQRNKVVSYPIQGSSFHCLLWSLIRIVQKELKRREMKTFLVSQVHDSMIADVMPEELDEYLEICNRVITVLLRQHYPWLIVPIDVEYEISPVGGSWADKAGYHPK